MPVNLHTLYICHLFLTVALGDMNYHSHFADKEIEIDIVDGKDSLPVSISVLRVFSFRSHAGSPAAPVLPGPHSSNYKGKGLPSLRLDLTGRETLPLRPLCPSP